MVGLHSGDFALPYFLRTLKCDPASLYPSINLHVISKHIFDGGYNSPLLDLTDLQVGEGAILLVHCLENY